MGGRLQGKVAIVTGGGSGFGLAIAEKFAEEGAKVLITDIVPGNAPKVAAANPSIKFMKADVSSRADWEKALETSLKEFGRLDIVVNNAGILIVKLTTEFTDEEYERLFRVNVKGLFQSSQVIIPHFEKQGGGVFVNISSSGDPRPRPYGAWYCATKAAVSNATRALAAEWAKANIRFNSIAPSTAETGMCFTLSGHKLMSRIGANLDVAGLDDSPENRLRLADLIPLGRLCKVSDVANMACFLASDEASYITGAQVPVDGGRAI